VCLWDDGSFDAADDPQSGIQSLCEGLGGTWIDDTMGGDWSLNPNADLAALVADLNSGQQPLIQMDVWAAMPGDSGGLSMWDFLSVPWSGTVLFPLVPFGPAASAGAGPTFAYNPKTDTGCYGLAGGAMVPATGRAVALGPLSVGNLGNADKILSGGSVFAGAQATPALGVQGMGNSSGLLAGPTFGTPGITAGASVSKCQGGVGKKLLNWFIDSIL